MNRLFFSFLLLFVFSFSAYAGYAYPKPPATWKPNPSGTGGLYKSPRAAHRDAANNNWYTDTATVYLPGAGDIKYPVSMKEAANAANFLAKRSFVPGMLGTAALALMAEWLSSAGLQTWIDPLTGAQVWAKPDTSGFTEGWKVGDIIRDTPENACRDYGSSQGWGLTVYRADQNLCRTNAGQSAQPERWSCPPPSIATPAGCVMPGLRPVTQPEFETIVEPLKIPVELPPLLPFELPVDDPRTNPKPFPFGDPAPFFVPTGDPVPAPAPRPDPDPYPWVEPGVDVKPSPKPAPEPDPFRLSPEPVNKPLPTPTPTPNPNPTPTPNPSPLPLPNPDPAPAPVPEKDPGLCALFPDILACEKLGDTPDAPELENKDINLSIEPISFGSNNGTCPPDKMITLSFVGRTVPITFSYVCQLASGIRPVVIALAWLSAAFIVLGMGRKS